MIGAIVGFAIGVVLAHSASQRGLLPYIVASQTVPILAIAPMVVVWMGSRGMPGLALGGGHRRVPDVLPRHDEHVARARSADPRALELMRSYAATTGDALEAEVRRRCRTCSPR